MTAQSLLDQSQDTTQPCRLRRGPSPSTAVWPVRLRARSSGRIPFLAGNPRRRQQLLCVEQLAFKVEAESDVSSELQRLKLAEDESHQQNIQVLLLQLHTDRFWFHSRNGIRLLLRDYFQPWMDTNEGRWGVYKVNPSHMTTENNHQVAYVAARQTLRCASVKRQQVNHRRREKEEELTEMLMRM